VTNSVTCLTATALDNNWLASGSLDKSVIIWNLADGTHAKLEGHTGGVMCLAVIDSNRLASGSEDKSIIIWNLADNTRLDKLEGHTGGVRGVSCLVALDGDRLASGGDYDGSIIIWNLKKEDGADDKSQLLKLEGLEQPESFKLEGHRGDVNCLAVLADGRLASSKRSSQRAAGADTPRPPTTRPLCSAPATTLSCHPPD
jgi:WD40 repeat protein